MPTPHSSQNQLPLAIVGMDCRLPGGDGLQEFWQSISTGRDAIRPMPAERLDRELYLGEEGQRGKTYAAIGGCVDDRELDWKLLRIAPDDRANWDACHLNLYEVAARACRDAGLNPLSMEGSNIGVYVGHSGGTTLGGELAMQSLAPEYETLLADAIGDRKIASDLLSDFLASRPRRKGGRPFVDASFSAGLVSHALGLRGPHMSIDAACASSLVALQLAASAIQTNQIDAAIVGGASYNKSDSLVLFSHARSCSATGSRPFDQEADGLVGSEGYVALVVKSLDRALRDGDRIHAIVRGIGMSSDGRGKSLWAPRKEGQFTAIQRAYDNALRPESIQFIEAHATSTQVGDATELTALADFYRQYNAAGPAIPVGSVKSNIGHTLETAGLAGIVKTILAMQHHLVPPSINVRQLNSSVRWEGGPLVVNTQPKELTPGGDCLRAAVNAFGIGGLNVHVVLEEGPSVQAAREQPIATNTHVSSHYEPESPPVVVGRGIVVPGAKSVAQLVQLAGDKRVVRSTQGGNRNTTNALQLGYVSDFHYDWRKHRIPPKQIAQANPLQFMLLDAAQQAIEEAGGLSDTARKRTAVVVG
ncbi:MAG TPA: beta keto-acyl synthase, partial [Planctomycetaceae bacterium]|nr:beta keto-acyl synthase [Planctomycetaceae bacterium]